ncbi:S24 family peptidase [Minwuia thermotolerans]|uniref:S24 family peptidase n=1 Tax=Minwuia thermotolerans TaxID=2056226 RepID=UPI0013DDEAF9|nr:helix-turn-helix transcriptional regulator [Minwuia thermotolerans]
MKVRSLQSYKTGTTPSAIALGEIAKATGFRLEWLTYGEGPMRPDEPPAQQQNHTQTQLADIRERVKAIENGVGSANGLEPGFVMIPRYDVEASAGPGMFSDQENVVDYMAFQRKWVRQALRADPDHLVLITAAGDSMEPVIRSGDLLLIDTSIDHFRDDAIYVIAMAGNLVVKRIQRFFTGGVSVKSDNPAYVEQTIGAGELDQVHVAGRVRWIGRLI